MSNIKLIYDSGCDLDFEISKEIEAVQVPLSLRLDDTIYNDDENLDTDKLITHLKKVKEHPSSACPSPEDYISRFERDKMNFVVTLSSKLSGSYNSAVVGKNIYLEENPDARVEIIDSKTASSGQAVIILKLNELKDMGLDFEEIKESIKEFIDGMKTYFIIDSMDNLIKTGRVSAFKGKVAKFLSIVPIMKGNDGGIELEEKVRGAKNAFNRLIEIIGEQGENLDQKILGISHCNAIDKAKAIRDEVLKRYNFKEVLIFETKGIATFYAGEGGIVISF
ncbi:MAG: DegV family protein [Andreesenia angusta]|nr:DegV family protein [Andreesenia angusta]